MILSEKLVLCFHVHKDIAKISRMFGRVVLYSQKEFSYLQILLFVVAYLQIRSFIFTKICFTLAYLWGVSFG